MRKIFSYFFIILLIISIGIGKIIVEFRSAATVVRV